MQRTCCVLFFFVLVFTTAGCRDRAFLNMGPGLGDREYGVASDSIDEYAREQGISREEALEQIRQQRRQLDEQATGPGDADSDAEESPPPADEF